MTTYTRSGVKYCTTHHGVKDEDDPGRCDFSSCFGTEADDAAACVFVDLWLERKP